MLRWLSQQEESRPSHTRANRVPPWSVWLPGLVLLSCPLLVAAAPAESSALPSAGFLSGFALGCFLLVIVAFLARTRLKVAKQELQKARELADHREYERNLAQQELVRRLEEERELAKEKLQFDSQLAEYEKYASLAQLALGAAHEINNPLLGIMSHLELEWKDASGEQRTEIEQCIEGAKRISSAVRGLLDYARPGPLLLGKVNLFKLVAETLKFVEHQPMFRHITLANRVPLDLPAITADVNQLSQILMNLLLNAAQATPAGGSITISAGWSSPLASSNCGCATPAVEFPPTSCRTSLSPSSPPSAAKARASGSASARATSAATEETFRSRALPAQAPRSA